MTESAPRASILLVDDKSANLMALEAVLEPLGQHLVRASSGEEALKALLHRDFACILLDVQMPGLDGLQTAALIKRRERSRHIPILFLTAIHRDAAHIFKGYAHGAVDYLLKPYEPEVLRSKVAVFVDLYQKEIKLQHQAVELREAERRTLERKSELRVRQLTDAMPLAMWAVDTLGTPYFVNRRFTEYTGLTVEAMRATGGWEAFHQDDRERVRSSWDASLATGTGLELSCRIRRAESEECRWHLLRAVPELDEEERLCGFIATATDIDDQKRAREAAEEANHTKDRFLASVSHELRTPLNAILGWTEMLRSGRLDPERTQRALDVIKRNGRLQAQLIEDLLDVSRIVAGKLRIDPQPIDLAAIAQAAADTVRPLALDRGVELALHIGRAPFEVVGDAARLQQVVWNLLTNAVKFSSAGGQVELSLRQAGDHAEVVVKDRGMGIAPDLLPLVFERFRQGEGALVQKERGLGLGLTIAQHLVVLHGGAIFAESAGEGRGATFTFRVPVAGPTKGMAGPTRASSSSGNLRAVAELPRLDRLKVLLIDEDRDARDLYAEFLRQAGAEVTVTAASAEARALIESCRIDVAVVGVPVEGGSLAAFLAERRVATIALSAHATVADRERSIAGGFRAHLAKPVAERALIEEVANVAGLRSGAP